MRSPGSSHLARGRRGVFVGIVLLVGSFFGTVTPTTAAPPPPGYPTSHILQIVTNTSIGIAFPLRLGFHDADPGISKGFGWDKMWNKHNLWDIGVYEPLASSTNHVRQGDTYLLNTWAGKASCGSFRCVITEQVAVRLVATSGHRATYSYQAADGSTVTVEVAPPGGAMGVVTAYCFVDDVRCPHWVTYSLTNPGSHNPYSIPMGDATPDGDSPTQISVDPSIAPVEGEDSEVVMYAYSYEPFPTEMLRQEVELAIDTTSPLNEVLTLSDS